MKYVALLVEYFYFPIIRQKRQAAFLTIVPKLVRRASCKGEGVGAVQKLKNKLTFCLVLIRINQRQW